MRNGLRALLNRRWGQQANPHHSAMEGCESISVHELGRPKGRLGNPNTGVPETLVQDVYDIFFAQQNQATVELILFANQIGQAYASMGVTSFNKTTNHTNLTQGGMLDSSYTFIIRGIAIDVHGLQGATHPYLHPEDLFNFTMTYGELQINHKPYLQTLLGWCPAGGGPFGNGFGTLTAAASATCFTNGLPYRTNIFVLPGGIFINPQENFSFVISPQKAAGGAWSTLATAGNPSGVVAGGISAWVRLCGQLTRVA